MNYEELFVRGNFMTNDIEKKKLLKMQILRTAHISLSTLFIIRKKLNKFDVFHSDNHKIIYSNVDQIKL